MSARFCCLRLPRMTVVVLGLALCTPAAHAFTFQPNKMQYYLMPDYCKAKMSDFHANREGFWSIRFPINEKEIAYWKHRIGSDWHHMHHYCAGVAYLSEAQDPADRRADWHYHLAVMEIRYTWSKSGPTAPLWPQMTLDYARANEGNGDRQKALELLTQLIGQAPDNPHVYLALAQTLKRGGDLEKAIPVLEEGLKKVKVKGPLLFYLPRFYYEAGNVDRAAELIPAAEKAGMKMDTLRKKLGMPLASGAETASGDEPAAGAGGAAVAGGQAAGLD